jgi:hypothetical protein
MLLVCAMALAVASSGCVRTPRQITSVWPIAVSEATVDAPPGGGRFALTGLPVPEGATITTVPVCAVLHAGPKAPLFGVGSADVVYETGNEVSGSDLSCLFASDVPARIEPIGAAGMADLWIAPQYRAMIFSSGASASLAASLRQQGVGNGSRNIGAPFAAAYQGASGLLGGQAVQIAAEYGSQVASAGPARLHFSPSMVQTRTPTLSVTVPLSPALTVQWRFDRASKTYGRWVGTSAMRDAASGRPIRVSSLVVMWAQYSPLDTDISGGGYDITLGGSGKVSVFRDGQRLDGRWKADGESPPRFFAEDGTAIKLAPGQTWVDVIPLSGSITMRQ